MKNNLLNTLLIITVLWSTTPTSCDKVYGVNIHFNTTRQHLGFTYRYFVTQPTPSSWVDFRTAEKACGDWGGHLTSIHSDDELRFLKRLIATKTPGMSRVFVGYDFNHWTDGTLLVYKSWQTDQELTYIKHPSSRTLKQQAFICKKPKKEGEGCHDPRRFKTAFTVTRSPMYDYHKLTKVAIKCNRSNVFFEVRYRNGVLCVCGRLVNPALRTFECVHKEQQQHVKLIVTVEKLSSKKNACDFTLTFQNNQSDISKVKVTINLPKDGSFESSTVGSPSSYAVTKTISVTTGMLSSMVSTTQNSLVTSPSSSYAVTTTHDSSTVSHAVPQTTSSTILPSSSVYSSPTQNMTSSPYIISSSVYSTYFTPVLSSSSAKAINSSMVKSVVKTTSTIQPAPTSVSLVATSSISPNVEKEEKFKKDLNFINEVNTSNVRIADQKTILQVLDAAANLIESNRTNKSDQGSGLKAVTVLENLGQTISRQLELGNKSEATYQKTTKELVFGVAVVNTTTTSGLSFPEQQNNDVGDERIDIPKSLFVSIPGKAYFVGIIFNGAAEMKKETNDGFVMGSRVINAEISPPPPDTLEKPVVMTFEKLMNGSQQDCSFWIEDKSKSGKHGRWSTEQCSQFFQNETHIQCACYHFTNFAVLFKISKQQEISEKDAFSLQIITYVGLILSILGCFLTFVIYVSFRNIKSDRATIHTNLVLALGIADVIFLITIMVKPVKDSCLATAMLAFYFYLAVFFWMFVEGVYIYLMVIKVFRGNTTRRRRAAYAVGWGCPVIIAVVTWAVLRDDVISKYHCWLSVETGAIWAFVGPALFIILVNLIILITVMRTTWETFVDDKEYGGLKSATKTFGAVIPILGITWVFGVMAFNQSSLVFQYIFAITNSVQGVVIFILYCLVNSEVRTELNRKYIVWQTRRDVSSSSTGRRPTYIISSEKNTTFNRTTPTESTPKNNRPLVQEHSDPQVVVAKNYTFEDHIGKEGFELDGGCAEPDRVDKLSDKFGVGYV